MTESKPPDPQTPTRPQKIQNQQVADIRPPSVLVRHRRHFEMCMTPAAFKNKIIPLEALARIAPHCEPRLNPMEVAMPKTVPYGTASPRVKILS